MIDDDTKQRFYTTFQFLLETYKVIIASLLCIFVPQRCINQPDQLCTLKDNLTELNEYNTICVYTNFTTLAFFLFLYIYEYKRERWCIEYLDIDQAKLNDYLYSEIESYPEYKDRIYKFNRRYYILSVIVIILNIVNIILSGILIFNYYYLDYRSVSVFLTNCILTIDRLMNAYNISTVADDPTNHLLAVSSYMTNPVVYNTIDKDYKKEVKVEMTIHEENKNIKHMRFEKNKIKLLAEKYSKK
jgi:hypothetical protein